jgi:hypothetical protein
MQHIYVSGKNLVYAIEKASDVLVEKLGKLRLSKSTSNSVTSPILTQLMNNN